MEIQNKKLLALTLALTTFLAMFGVSRTTVCTEYIDVDDYCWIEGESLDIGFSKYGEMIGYNEDTEIGLGMQYPGYETAGGTYDQTDGASVDPFCNEEIAADWWMNGWFIDIKYIHPASFYREIWAMSLFSDGTQHGGDWIVMPYVASDSAARPIWQEYPPYANPDSTAYWGVVDPIPETGGRKTNGHAETDPIEIIYNGPRKFIAICTTRVSDVGGAVNLVDLTFTFIFNKAEKNIILLKDINRLYKLSPLNIQFGNRGQWDLGISPDTDSYIHWYTSEPVQYWDQDDDGAINCTEVEASFETFKDYFLTNKHPEKWWDEVPSDERPTTVCDEWTEEMIPFPETWLEAQETAYGREQHLDDTIKERSCAVAQVIAQDGDYVAAVAVWPHPEFWAAHNLYYPPYRTTLAGGGHNPSALPLMLSPISRMLEWYKWTVEEDPTSDEYPYGYLDDRSDIWVKVDDVVTATGATKEPTIPFTIYEHDFELSSSLPEYRTVSVYTLTDRHDGDDRDALRGGNMEDWSSGVNQIDSEIQHQLDQIFSRVHDVKTKSVTPFKGVVGQGQSVAMNITLENQGGDTETFDVTAYADSVTIDTIANITLTSGESKAVTFTWDTTGVAKGNYTIRAYAIPVPGEIDIADNMYVDGWIVVTTPGDMDGDYDVDFDDIVAIAMAYGSKPGDPNWNPNADIDGDGDVDFDDVVTAAMNYGK